MEIVESDYNLQLTKEKIDFYTIFQQTNSLFDQIIRITNDDSKFIKYTVFVDCKNGRNKKLIMTELLTNGFKLNGIRYVLSEKSSSMGRQSVLLFIQECISKELNEIVTMGMDISKDTVLSKYLAYRGLMLSSSWNIPNFKPYCIIVDDYYKIIPNQKIIGVVDLEKSFINKDGKKIFYKEKANREETKSVTINCFDGSGICHPRVVDKIKETLECEYRPNVFIFRMPYVKGLLAEVDFVRFYEERDIYEIIDVWGKKHSIYDIDIIMTKSQYKAYGYFNKTGTYADYEYYWKMFNKYNHSFRVAKINFSFEGEQAKTKINYQVLQTLDLDKEKFLSLSDYSKKWVENIISGKDIISTMCFLGLKNNKFKASNAYMKAILKNNEMIKDPMVKKYLYKILKKNIDDFKTGRLYIDGSFQFMFGDVVALLEHIGGLEVKGVLEADEFFSQDVNGVKLGKHTLLRNPHITASENRRLYGVTHPLLEQYAKGLSNMIMVNHKSLILSSLNGSDL